MIGEPAGQVNETEMRDGEGGDGGLSSHAARSKIKEYFVFVLIQF